MEKMYKVSLISRGQASVVRIGCEVDGTPPSAAELQVLADELHLLAQQALDREQATQLEEGKYYRYRRKGGFGYVQYRGFDDQGVRIIAVDKEGVPVDAGSGPGAEVYFGFPVSRLELLKVQPAVATV